MTYAARTEVSSEKSRAEIERTLRRYGADQFAYGWDRISATVGFRASGRMVRFNLPMPDPADFIESPAGRTRTASSAEKAYEQAVRSRWRALGLAIKAKLESVEAGIESFDEAFLPHLLLPDGSTVGESALPGVEAAYETGRMPVALLPAGA